jgi:hypothetical protein
MARKYLVSYDYRVREFFSVRVASRMPAQIVLETSWARLANLGLLCALSNIIPDVTPFGVRGDSWLLFRNIPQSARSQHDYPF